jgi:hypothetical protein
LRTQSKDDFQELYAKRTIHVQHERMLDIPVGLRASRGCLRVLLVAEEWRNAFRDDVVLMGRFSIGTPSTNSGWVLFFILCQASYRLSKYNLDPVGGT